MDRVPNVKESRTITQAHIPQGERRDRTLPVILSRNSKRVRPRIIRIELQAVPAALPEVNLKSVIVRISFRGEFAKANERCKRVDLEEVEWVRSSRS